MLITILTKSHDPPSRGLSAGRAASSAKEAGREKYKNYTKTLAGILSRTFRGLKFKASSGCMVWVSRTVLGV